MKEKAICGIVFVALMLTAGLPTMVVMADDDDNLCWDCLARCDIAYSVCRHEICDPLPQGDEKKACYSFSRHDFIDCNLYCRREVCSRAFRCIFPFFLVFQALQPASPYR
ncbi:MAG: hypothetical protein HXS40_11345 [Theionarchaea archaeon]|nr:hypothetical protein [Theionarchaea archaeon]